MEYTLKELEDKLKEFREMGANDNTTISFDGDSDYIDFGREIFPNIYYYGKTKYSDYIVVQLN